MASSHALRKGMKSKSTQLASRKFLSSPRKSESHVLEQSQERVSFQVNLNDVYFLNRFLEAMKVHFWQSAVFADLL